MFKDDKLYLWLCIKKEWFLRVFFIWKFIKDGSEYYGFYISGKIVYILLDLIKGLYLLCICNYDLVEEKI